MIASDIMTKEPVYAEATETVAQIKQKLFTLDVRHIPVVDAGELVGFLSDRDLDGGEMPPGSFFQQPVSHMMQSDVVYVHPETEVAEIIRLLVEHKIGAVPVVDPLDSKLVGIVSYIDVLRAARELF